jgi:hypothetical protein
MNEYLGSDISSVDIPMAYLSATLKVTIYIKLTSEITTIYFKKHPEFAQDVDNRGRIVVKILKCLYGLKQSGLAWSDEFTSTLKDA